MTLLFLVGGCAPRQFTLDISLGPDCAKVPASGAIRYQIGEACQGCLQTNGSEQTIEEVLSSRGTLCSNVPHGTALKLTVEIYANSTCAQAPTSTGSADITSLDGKQDEMRSATLACCKSNCPTLCRQNPESCCGTVNNSCGVPESCGTASCKGGERCEQNQCCKNNQTPPNCN